MKRAILLVDLASAALASPARADERAACVEAASNGQTLRDAHKLIEARDQFRVCASAGCPSVVQSDCAAWLDAAEKGLPTVVFAARSDGGADLIDVKVILDGQPLLTKLQGAAVAINPGPHTLHFEAAGGATVDQTVMIKEGEKDRAIAVVLSTSPGAPSAGPPLAPGSTPIPASPSTPAPPESQTAATWRTLGWVLGGAGVVGIVVGVAFGVEAMAKKSDANCANGFCDAGPLSDARSAGNVSTIGFIAGGALAAGASPSCCSPRGQTPQRPGSTCA